MSVFSDHPFMQGCHTAQLQGALFIQTTMQMAPPGVEKTSDAAFIYPYTCRHHTQAQMILYNWDYLTMLFQHGHHKIK